MNIIQKIKDIIFKIKDYDRLEMSYCGLLDMATGGILSKPYYTDETVRECVSNYLYQHDRYLKNELKKPSKRIQKILNAIGEDATWMVVSVYSNGGGWELFRGGTKIKESDLTEKERDWLESWVFCAYNNGLFKRNKK